MRLIDADALIDRWRKNLNITEKDTGAVFVGYGQIPAMINNMPTADAVPVVRCKDCKYYMAYYHGAEGISRECVWHWTRNIAPKDFCSKGEKR